MAATPKRGAVSAPRSGVYRDPATDGVKETGGPGTYRPPADGIRDITDINYIPYGGVYEREGDNPFDRVATGGVFERYTEPDPVVINTFIISYPYPPLVEDMMTLDSLITGGSLILIAIDQLDVDALITSGTLNPLLLSYTIPVEEISVSGSLTSGTITTLLLSYTIPVEEISVGAEITSGTLTAVGLSYSNWPAEEIDIDAIITGGTLA